MTRRLLLLSVSAGAGHVRAAEALRAAAADCDVEVLHLDVMQHVPRAFRVLYTDLYLKLVEHSPATWAMLYRIMDRTPPGAPAARLRRAIERLHTLDLRREIARFAPDVVVCTHFLPAELLMRERSRGRLACPVHVVVTDFDLHGMWVVPDMAGWFAASDEVAFRMRARGLDAARIHVTGIPIMPAFAQPHDRAACAAEFGIDPARRAILLMGGGAGLGGLDEVAARLLALDADFQLVALAGRNAKALEALQALAARHPRRLLAQGFTDKVDRLMHACDLVITKPGGLTTSECLALGKPMIVHAPIPGQEERNCDYLLEQGAAQKAVDAVALEYRVRELVADPSRLARLAARSAAIGRPHAARDVLARVLEARGIG
ncbi:MGDG synthase family glycosyltransferase [Dokdonella fugitiva]|jgi:processive 1,2-diacylglycerol beta-glucosyltransferase|uniref:MGDG synthase family glycosyltransferase n=1 Tax=Dokdonella fugitiva TaxID=328517 RepID=UPI0015FE7E40|nr:glycosyltransferase [Dokdonella fugitiva]MBA8883734.1 processive 1,2-diacylglycerol beta-glucosyltransferase [Dokdonella fugitiva]